MLARRVWINVIGNREKTGIDHEAGANIGGPVNTQEILLTKFCAKFAYCELFQTRYIGERLKLGDSGP